MYKSKCHGFISDMDKTELLAMRERGMSNREIAEAVGCHFNTIIRLIGPQPREITNRSIHEGWKKRVDMLMDGTPAVEPVRGGAAVREEEPKKAVLVVKTLPPMPIPLHGTFMDYVISADRTSVDVETEQGRCLLQIPMDKLDTFIEELNAIRNNIGSDTVLPFWGWRHD